ncbi:MAG: WD40 repeat domain-containing protein, partial [Candidatus Hodarchaeota archaeon]
FWWYPTQEDSTGALVECLIYDIKTGMELASISGHSGSVWACSWSPDGKYIASGCFHSLLNIWDVEKLIQDS